MRQRFQNVLIAGFIAGVVAACSGPAMEAMGGAMLDAGHMLEDAGTAMMAGSGSGADGIAMDAGRMLRDAGDSMQDAGHSLHEDAGRSMRDAGLAMQDSGQSVRDDATRDGSAQAQQCGEWCSTEGAARMITADQDTTRWNRGSVSVGDWTLDDANTGGATHYYMFQTEVLEGPFVLRSSRFEDNDGNGGLYVVEDGADCGAAAAGPVLFVRPAHWIALESDPQMVLGTEKLCAWWLENVPMASPAPTAPRLLTWGYRPYD